MLSMHENWLLDGYISMHKICSSLAEHAQKLVTRWLSMRENWLLLGWACAKIGYSLVEHTQKSFRCTTGIIPVVRCPTSFNGTEEITGSNSRKESNSRNANNSDNTRNWKDPCNIRNASNSRDASNNRDASNSSDASNDSDASNEQNNWNESSNRNANPVGTPSKAGTLARVVKPVKACRNANYSRDTIYIRNNSSRDVNNSIAAGPLEPMRKSATVEKSAKCSMETGCRKQCGSNMPTTRGNLVKQTLLKSRNCPLLSDRF